MNVQSEKRLIRHQLRSLRQGLEPDRITRLGAAISLHARQLSEYDSSRNLALYLPIDHEVDPTALMAHALDQGKSVFLPVVHRSERLLTFHRHVPEMPLGIGAYGIPEPEQRDAGLAGEALGRLDLIFLPLVGYDREGFRLGFGGGYYDRALGQCLGLTGRRPVLAGLAYRFQEVSRLPREPHDMQLDLVVHEEGIERFR